MILLKVLPISLLFLMVRCQETANDMLNEYMRFLRMINTTLTDKNSLGDFPPFPPFLRRNMDSNDPDYVPFMSIDDMRRMLNMTSSNPNMTSFDLNNNSTNSSDMPFLFALFPGMVNAIEGRVDPSMSMDDQNSSFQHPMPSSDANEGSYKYEVYVAEITPIHKPYFLDKRFQYKYPYMHHENSIWAPLMYMLNIRKLLDSEMDEHHMQMNYNRFEMENYHTNIERHVKDVHSAEEEIHRFPPFAAQDHPMPDQQPWFYNQQTSYPHRRGVENTYIPKPPYFRELKYPVHVSEYNQ